MKTHHAWIEPATESDNTEYASITCDPEELIEDPEYSNNWEDVSCKRCLVAKPAESKELGG